MTPEVKIRKWKSDDGEINDLLTIMSESHRREVEETWLRQKLSWGRGGVGALAYSADVPVGIVLFGAAPYEVDGHPLDVALSFDTFVHPDYRGQGLFQRLLSTAEEGCRESGFQLLLNFPNEASRPGFAKAGWKPLAPMRPFLHLSHRRPTQVFRRYAATVKDYRAPFRPISTPPVDYASLRGLKQLENAQTGLRFSVSEESLKYRLDERRGYGYDAITTDDFGAIVRRGKRGSLNETQVLVTSPRELSHGQSRDLLRRIDTEFRSDLVSQLLHSGMAPLLPMALSGYVALNSRTTAYYKELATEAMPEKVRISGIDIHTW